MTKIAIFGDSFAANPHTEALSSPTTEGFIKEIYAINNRKYKEKELLLLTEKWGQKYKSWTRYLNADVYAHSGSDIYYSYNQFINNHQSYDKCIFVITSPYRFSSFATNEWLHCASIDDAIEKVEFSSDRETKQYFTTLTKFFKDILYKDLKRSDVINQALLDNIKFIKPDTIFINAYPDLKLVYDLELKGWNTTHEESQDYTKYFDLRHCHMTNENNKILADFVENNINKSGYLDLSTVKWNTTTEKSNYLVNTKNVIDWLLS